MHGIFFQIQKVSSVILGVKHRKNTKELIFIETLFQECIEAESKENLNEVQLKEFEN